MTTLFQRLVISMLFEILRCTYPQAANAFRNGVDAFLKLPKEEDFPQ